MKCPNLGCSKEAGLWPRGTQWGVDTLAKANTSPNGGSQTLFEAVKSYYGQEPDFWGRYLNGTDPLDIAEVNYLLNEKFSQILPNLRGAKQTQTMHDY